MAELRFLTAGESHGPALTVILEGIPAGLRLDPAAIDAELARRQRGYGRGGRMKIETDRAEVTAGVRFGETLGSPIVMQVKDRDFANWTERMAAFGAPAGERVTQARPGHADLAGVMKYARGDIRDILERSSARETAMRVAAGAVAKQFLAACGVAVSSRVTEIGGVRADGAADGNDASELNCRDAAAEVRMKEAIDAARAAGDTLGGVFEVTVTGAPAGLGSHVQWDRRLDARLAGAMMSIQAVKGVEIGEGFGCAALPGSRAHDEVFFDEARGVFRETNRAGGLEGGMTNGAPVVIRAAMKPIPTLMKPLRSIDIASKEPVLASKERSDVCAVPAASVVGEAMAALAVAGAVVEKFGGDSMRDLLDAMRAYRARLEGGPR